MNKMYRYINSTIVGALIALPLLLSGCSDDNIIDDPESESFGSQQSVELPADFSAVLPQGETTLSLIYDTGKPPVSVKVNHYVSNGRSVFDFGRSLRTGNYVIASATRRDEDGIPQDTHIGCTMRVSANQNSIYPSTFDVAKALFGSGTAEDPYRIASSKGLKVMRELFADGKHQSKDLCFLQIADIDMTRDYNKGFEPIAPKSAYPFEGNYDGGGHSIYYCAVRTLDGKGAPTTGVVPATGLFGYVAGATFRNITMVDPVSIGAGSTGTLIGAVVGISGIDQTPTVLRNIRVRQESSTASEVYGTNFVGGIVGGVDANALLMMTACVNENLPVSNEKEGSFIGGLVGGGTINATAVLDSCVNHARVSAAGVRCTGGIIGGVEAANISNCINYGGVNAPSCMGVGGIAGGLGTSSMAAVVNEGEVTGSMGTGGILGSTVMNREDGSFNDIIMTSAHNYATVRGTDNTGGIVGEAQAMLSDCYNRGQVIGSGTFAGGMMGFAPVAVIHSCYNNSPVNASVCAGGIVGRSAYYILTSNSNLGVVNSSNGMAAGILALGGSTGMINFCTNYGAVYGSDITAGIIARAGDSYSLNAKDVSSLIVSYGKTTNKVIKALKTPPAKVSEFKAMFKKGQKVLKIFTSTKDLLETIATPLQLQDLSHWDTLYDKELPARNEELVARMHSEVTASMPAFSFGLKGLDGLPEMVHGNMTDFDNSLQGDDDDLLTDAIHDRLTEINEQVAKVEKAREILIAAASCVLAVAGMVVSGGAATAAVLVCSAAVSTVGTLTQRFDNCVEISQCCNFGDINAGDNGYGIVARLGDHVRLQDCLSVGEASGYGVSDKSEAPFDDIKVYRTISVGKANQRAFSHGNAMSQFGNFSLVEDDYFIGGASETGVAKAARLADKSTYTGYAVTYPYDFDDKHYWNFMVAPVPAPYNNLYFSFR